MRYQAVIFDFDYTLGDATPSIYEGFCYGLERMGHPRPELEAVRHTVGHMLEDSYTILTGNADPARKEEFRRLFHEKVGATQAEKTLLCPGALELLQALHGAGVRTGIVTSKRSSTLRRILDWYGLTELLEFYIGGEMVERPKPDPEGLNRGIELVGVPRERVLYCGDTVIDAATAQGAGVDFAAVLNGTTPAEAFEPYPRVRVSPGLPDLKRWLEV